MASSLGPLREKERASFSSEPSLSQTVSLPHRPSSTILGPGVSRGDMWGGAYARMRPGSASDGNARPEAWSAALDHQDQVPSWDGAEEPLRSCLHPQPPPQESPQSPPCGAPQTVLFRGSTLDGEKDIQSWENANGFSLRLCPGWELTSCTTINTSAVAPFPSPLHQAGFLHQSARKPSPLLGGCDYVLFSLIFPGPGRDISTRCVFI